MKTVKSYKSIICTGIILCLSLQVVTGQTLKNNPALDEKVKKFLSEHSNQWYDMNISAADGQLMHDIIVKNNYKNALEIGTSTGHSGIWIAWALSKTGGKLITLDIDENRRSRALQNFKEAGLSDYIDSRLGDAHTIVKELKGPFDFVFSDADKDWYINYFNEVDPKLEIDGCYVTHNVRGSSSAGNYGGRGSRGGGGYDGGYYNYVMGLKHFESNLHRVGRDGLLISYKRSQK